MGKTPVRSKTVNMTPGMAKKRLSHNHSNRKIKPRKVRLYADMMRNGEWQLGPTISFNGDGKLLDGQHRLLAIIESGVTVPMIELSGVPDGAQQYMDRGATRTISDCLHMFDGQKNPNKLVAIVRLVEVFESGVKRELSLDGTRATLARYEPQLELLRCVDGWCGLPGNVVAPCVYVASVLPAALDFLQSYSTLEGLKKGSPVLALRRINDAISAGKAAHRGTLVQRAARTFNALRYFAEDVNGKRLFVSPVGYDWAQHVILGKGTTRRRRGDKGVCRHLTAHELGCRRHCDHPPAPRASAKRRQSLTDSASGTDTCWLHWHLRAK
jgi:hypothetical protein